LRIAGFSALLHFILRSVLLEGGDQPMSDERQMLKFDDLKRYVASMEHQSVLFYAYREAINEIEEELYGVPLFDEKSKAGITKYYDEVDELIKFYNHGIRGLCGDERIREYIKPMVQDTESFLLKKPVPSSILVEQLVGGIRGIADAELRMMMRR